MNENAAAMIGLSMALLALNVAISAISWRVQRRTRSRAILFFMITWLFYAGSSLLDLVTVILTDDGNIAIAQDFFKINYAILVPVATMSFLAFAEYLQHDAIGLKRMLLLGLVNGALFSWIFNPSFQLHEEAGFLEADLVNQLGYWILSSAGIWIGVLSFTRWSIASWRKAPRSLKKPTLMLMIAALVDIIALVMQFSYDPDVVVATSFVSLALVLIIVLVIQKHPTVIHLLPYKVYKLLLASKNGVTIYEKSWCQEEIDPDMVSSLLTAMSTFAEQDLRAVHPGKIAAIKMQNTILLTALDRPVLNVVLVASQASMELRSALDRFSADLFKLLDDKLYCQDWKNTPPGTLELQQIIACREVDALVTAHFSNIPRFT